MCMCIIRRRMVRVCTCYMRIRCWFQSCRLAQKEIKKIKKITKRKDKSRRLEICYVCIWNRFQLHFFSFCSFYIFCIYFFLISFKFFFFSTQHLLQILARPLLLIPISSYLIWLCYWSFFLSFNWFWLIFFPSFFFGRQTKRNREREKQMREKKH